MGKAREFWIVNDNFTNPEHQISKAYHYPPNLLFPVIHVIEYSAYEALKFELDCNTAKMLTTIMELQAERQRNEKLVAALEWYARNAHNQSTVAIKALTENKEQDGKG